MKTLCKCSVLFLKEREGTAVAFEAEGSSVDWELKSDSPLTASSSNSSDTFCGFLWLKVRKRKVEDQCKSFRAHALHLFTYNFICRVWSQI